MIIDFQYYTIMYTKIKYCKIKMSQLNGNCQPVNISQITCKHCGVELLT